MTIRYGNEDVPIFRRNWTSAGGNVPYPATFKLRVGEHWKNAPKAPEYSEHYVLLRDDVIVYPQDRQLGLQYIPAGAAIARELVVEGASSAVWTECVFGNLVLIGP